MPRCFVWENVPGALSSENGEAFRCLLRAMDEVGYGLHGEFWTRNSSAWPSDASVSFLSECLEAPPVPARYYLSPTACAGIIRRARRRGRSLAAAAGGGARTAGFKYSAAPASGSVGHAAEQSPTLTADWHAPAVYGIVGNSIGRKPENGGNGAGFCDPDEKGMYTLTAADRHAVALPAGGPPREALCLASTHANAHVGDGLCGCLTAERRQGAAHGVPFGGDAANAACDVDLAGTLKVGGSPSCVGPVAAFAQNTRDEVRFVGGSGSHVGALAAHPGVKQASHVLQGPAVRRPHAVGVREAARLPGQLDERGVPRQGPAPDGRRYKALGKRHGRPGRQMDRERVEKARLASAKERASSRVRLSFATTKRTKVRLEVGGVEPDDIARAEQLATSHPPTGPGAVDDGRIRADRAVQRGEAIPPPCFPNNGEDGERRGGERGAPGRAQDDPLHFEQLSYDEPLVGPVARI